MSRDVCGICWCPYDEDGECGCKPVKVIDPAADEALLRQAKDALEYAYENLPLIHAGEIVGTLEALKERLK